MKLYHSIKNWFIGSYLSKTTDFYERTKIELNFSFSFFISLALLPAALYLLSVQLWAVGFPVLLSVLITILQLFILKFFQNIKLSSFLFSYSILSFYFINLFIVEDVIFIGAPIWIIIQLLLITFNLGLYWGIGTTLLSVTLFGIYINTKMISDLGYLIENPQLLSSLIPEITVGFSVIIYLLFVFFKTSRNAEQQLLQTNKALTLKNVLIEKQHTEKEVLLQEVHHRVKNNMQIISSLIRLQDQEINDPTISHVFNQAQQRIMAIAMIHERMYKAPELNDFKLVEYIESLSADILRQYSNKQEINLTVQGEDIHITHSNIVPLGLILHELIANSVIHGIKETGEINIHLKNSTPNLSIEYYDSGIGFKENYTPGFGTNLIRILSEQLNAELVFKTELNKGVSYIFTFEEL